MQTQEASTAKLTTVAVFPENSLLENLAVRADGSILVTEILQGQLWYVPPEGVPADPVPVHTFGRFTMGVVEAGPDVYYINTSDPFSARKSYLHRLTGQKLLMRVPVDPSTYDPAGPAEFVASGKLDQPTSRYGTGRYAPRTALLANLCDEHRLGDRNLHVDAPVSRSVIGPGHRRRAPPPFSALVQVRPGRARTAPDGTICHAARPVPISRSGRDRASQRFVSSARPSGALQYGDLLCQFRLTNQGCQSKLTGMDIEKLSEDVSSDDPAVGLRASLALHRLAERVEAHHVASAREKGWSWQQIGDALGITRQSVHTKYNKELS